jgi:hypothetical protein
VPTQASSISVPLPIPSGVPAGGIFAQMAAYTTRGSVGVLNVDAVTVDLSTLSTAPVATSGTPGAVQGGPPASLATQSSDNTRGSGVLKSSIRLSSGVTPTPVPIETVARPARQRAELPEVAALAGDGIASGPLSDAVQVNPNPSIDSTAEPTKNPEELVAGEAPAAAASRMELSEADTAETALNDKRIPANLAIYSAGAVTVAVSVSAPGLSSFIRRGQGRYRRRSTVAPRG